MIGNHRSVDLFLLLLYHQSIQLLKPLEFIQPFYWDLLRILCVSKSSLEVNGIHSSTDVSSMKNERPICIVCKNSSYLLLGISQFSASGFNSNLRAFQIGYSCSSCYASKNIYYISFFSLFNSSLCNFFFLFWLYFFEFSFATQNPPSEFVNIKFVRFTYTLSNIEWCLRGLFESVEAVFHRWICVPNVMGFSYLFLAPYKLSTLTSPWLPVYKLERPWLWAFTRPIEKSWFMYVPDILELVEAEKRFYLLKKSLLAAIEIRSRCFVADFNLQNIIMTKRVSTLMKENAQNASCLKILT